MAGESLVLEQPARILTVEEWIALPEELEGELVEGKREEEEVPSYIHELLVVLLGQLLGSWILPRGGFIAASGVKFVLGPELGRKPDLSVFFPGRQGPPPQGPVETPPDIAIEIVSSSPRDQQRDRVDKVEDYAAFGIKLYWILDPQLRILEILELDQASGRYVHVLRAKSGRMESIPGCQGLVVDLDALWSEVDRLEEPRIQD